MTIKDDFGDLIEEIILDCPAPGKHAARSAVRHLSKARDLQNLDPEMSIFRAITAEEESATAVFHAVMRRRYDGAEQLDVTSHVHKTALHPFLLAVGKFLDKTLVNGEFFPTLECNENESPKKLKTRITVKVDGEEKWAYPLPPLNHTLKLNDEIHDFSVELGEVADSKQVKNMSKYVTKLAKRRNGLLYAMPNGIPSVEGDIEPFLIYRETVVYSNLALFLLIDPYKEKQLFVQQCLDAFITILPNVRRKKI